MANYRRSPFFGLLLIILVGMAHPAWARAFSPTDSSRLLSASTPADTVRLGVLVPDSDVGRAVRHSAALAIAVANDAGGYRGRPFKLVIRSEEGPWGSGSKAIAQLVFDDDVWAILGGLDGRGAHLAEQIVTKGRVALVSPWASDPTLTQINIPWFFRCVPDDQRQAQALTEAILETEGVRKVAVVTETTYDAQMGASAFMRAVDDALSINQYAFRADDTALQDILNQIIEDGSEGIVFYGPSTQAARLVRQMQTRGMNQPVFGPLYLSEEVFLQTADASSHEVHIVAPGHWEGGQGADFMRSFQNRYGYGPPTIAFYAYDGMNAMLEAIRHAGLDREAIREALATLTHEGLTGPLQFDAQGNRMGLVSVVDIYQGRPDF